MKLADVITVLKVTLPVQVAADVLNCLVSCEDDERLTDEQAMAGQLLFDGLCHARPDAVEVATGGGVIG